MRGEHRVQRMRWVKSGDTRGKRNIRRNKRGDMEGEKDRRENEKKRGVYRNWGERKQRWGKEVREEGEWDGEGEREKEEVGPWRDRNKEINRGRMEQRGGSGKEMNQEKREEQGSKEKGVKRDKERERRNETMAEIGTGGGKTKRMLERETRIQEEQEDRDRERLREEDKEKGRKTQRFQEYAAQFS